MSKSKVSLMTAEEAKKMADDTYTSSKVLNGLLKDVIPLIRQQAKDGYYKCTFKTKTLQQKLIDQFEAELVSKKYTVRYKIEKIYEQVVFDISWAEPSKTNPEGTVNANDN